MLNRPTSNQQISDFSEFNYCLIIYYKYIQGVENKNILHFNSLQIMFNINKKKSCPFFSII